MLTQYQKLRLLTAAGWRGQLSREAVMGMEVEGGICLAGAGDRAESQREELRELAAERGTERGDKRRGARH